MLYNKETLLALAAQLRKLSELPVSAPGAYDRIVSVVKSLQQNAAGPLIVSRALDVQFKAEDLFKRQHAMPEAVLREMLLSRLQLLEATIGATSAAVPLLSIERRDSNRVGRRAADRAAAMLRSAVDPA